jgi:hypothetical protein
MYVCLIGDQKCPLYFILSEIFHVWRANLCSSLLHDKRTEIGAEAICRDRVRQKKKKLDELWPVFQLHISLWFAFKLVLRVSLFSGNTESGDNHKKKFQQNYINNIKNLDKKWYLKSYLKNVPKNYCKHLGHKN